MRELAGPLRPRCPPDLPIFRGVKSGNSPEPSARLVRCKTGAIRPTIPVRRPTAVVHQFMLHKRPETASGIQADHVYDREPKLVLEDADEDRRTRWARLVRMPTPVPQAGHFLSGAP